MRAWNYTRMCIAAIAIAALVLCMPGCNNPAAGKAHGRRAVTALLDSAESMMNQAPEQAYRLLDSIDSRSLRSRALNARYALLFTEAQYKCYIQAPGDSLIMTAVKYYSVGNHPEQLFRSYYCLGCIYNEAGRLVDAAVALEQAEQLADKIDDGYRKGLLYTQLGNVFFYSYDFNRAEQYYRYAMDNYAAAGKEAHRVYALNDIGKCKYQNNDFANSHSIMTQVQNWAESNGDTKLVAACLLNRLSCSVYLNDIESSDKEFKEYTERFGEPDKNAKSISKLANYYILKSDYSVARRYLDKAWQVSAASDSVTLLYIESLLHENTGQTELANEYYKRSIGLQNNRLRALLNQPAIDAQKKYYKSLSEIESLKSSRDRNLIVFLISVFILLLIIARIINHAKRIESESEKQGLLLTIKELRLRDDTNNEKINQLNSRVNALFVKQYAELDEIFDKMIELDNALSDNIKENSDDSDKQKYYKKLSIFYNNIRDKFDDIKSNKNQKELDHIINDLYDNLMIHLSEKKYKLSKNDLLIIRLLISGFSAKVVGHIVSGKQKTIYQKRNRILKRIERRSTDLAVRLSNALRIN